MFKVVRRIFLQDNENVIENDVSTIFYESIEKKLSSKEHILETIKKEGINISGFIFTTHVLDDKGRMVKHSLNTGHYNKENENLELFRWDDWKQPNYWHDRMKQENIKFIIMGKSASGKDTFCRKMEEILEITSTISYTTRPMRPGEVNGVDYHFVSEKEFNKMAKQGKFLTTKSYDTKYGKWYYGKSLNELMNHDYIILTPEEKIEFDDAIGNMFEFKTIYFTANENIRKERSLNRGDDINEVNRRLETDKNDFKKFEKSLQAELSFGNLTVVDTTNMELSDYDNAVLEIAAMWCGKELNFN